MLASMVSVAPLRSAADLRMDLVQGIVQALQGAHVSDAAALKIACVIEQATEPLEEAAS